MSYIRSGILVILFAYIYSEDDAKLSLFLEITGFEVPWLEKEVSSARFKLMRCMFIKKNIASEVLAASISLQILTFSKKLL